MLADAKLPVTFWAEAVNTTCYVQNKVQRMQQVKSGNSNPTATLTNPLADQLETLTVETPIPTVSSPVPTACLNDSQEPSSDTRLISKRVSNQVETPSMDNILTLTNWFEDILRVTTNSVDSDGVEADVSNMETTITTSPTPTLRIHKDHPKSQIIGPVDTLIQTRHKSKKISDALQNPRWVEAMQEELLQFKIQNVWSLIDCPKGEEGIDYDEVFALVARIEAIILFLAYASFMGFTVYQMNVKSAFLYGTINEEVEFEALMHEKFQMSAMGEFNFFFGLPSFSGRIVPLFDSMLVPQGKGSGTPAESHHTPTSEASQSSQHELPSPSLPPVTTATVPPVIPTSPLPTVIPTDTTPLRHYTRRARIAQPSALLPVADEPASPLGDGSQEEAYPTDSSLARDQDRANIVKTSTLPSDSTPRATSLAADEGKMVVRFEAQGLEINSLKARIKVLEDKDRGVAEKSGDDAQSRGGATVLLSRVAEVPTGSGSIPTVDPLLLEFLLAVMWFPLLEYEQIPEDLSIGERIELSSDLVKYQENYAQVLKYQTLQRKPRSKKQKKDYYMAVIKGHADFIPMGSKEETERLKRKGLRLEQESAKKLKTSEEVPEEVKSSEEVPEEKVKEIMQRVPIEEHLDREDLNQLWRLVKESLSISEESSHRQKKRDATAEKIALLLKSSSNCQSNSYDNYAKLVPDRQLSTIFKLKVEREKGVYPVGFKGKGKEKGLAELAGIAG
nr:hypothetical protein [Tanacetum cinerariifolium]